jgi:hypothetical protein
VTARLARGEVPVGLLLRQEDEGLSALAGDGEDWNDRLWRRLPDDAGLDQLGGAQMIEVLWTGALSSMPCNWLSTCGERKSTLVVSTTLPSASRSSPAAHVHLTAALGRDVDVGFEVFVLIHRRQGGGRCHIVAEMHGDIANDAIERGLDLVIGKLLFKRLAGGDAACQSARVLLKDCSAWSRVSRLMTPASKSLRCRSI